MKSLTDLKEINKILRTVIIAQSQLLSANVRNALSLHGEDLEKLIEGTVYNSYEVTDCFALFELKYRDSSNNISFTNTDQTNDPVTIQNSFAFQVMIYGNASPTTAALFTARMRTAKVRQDLMTQGVYIERVENPVSINEYINDSMWIRTDVVINISCEMLVQQVSNDYQVSSYNSVNTIP